VNCAWTNCVVSRLGHEFGGMARVPSPAGSTGSKRQELHHLETLGAEDYPLVNIQSWLLKMAIEIVSFPMNSRWFSIISYVNIYQRVGCPAGSRINKPDGKSMEILDSIELLHGWSALPTYPRKKRYLQEIDNYIPEIIIFGEHQLKSPNVNLSVFFHEQRGPHLVSMRPCPRKIRSDHSQHLRKDPLDVAPLGFHHLKEFRLRVLWEKVGRFKGDPKKYIPKKEKPPGFAFRLWFWLIYVDFLKGEPLEH